MALASHERSTPVEVSLPGRSETFYGMVGDIKQAVDVKPDGQPAVALSVQLWDVA